MKKTGLVLEGGAMRGMYTAGVLDVLLENNIPIDGIIGVSAGALFGVNYFSKQKGRVIRYSKRFCKTPRYMGMLSYLLTGNVVNRKFAYYKVAKELDPFDEETFIKQNKEFYAVATDIETGKPDYIKINKCLEQIEVLRATSAMPLASQIIKIGDKKYLDGAVSDSIPLKKLQSLGYQKIIVVLTQPLDYRKPELDAKTIYKISKKFKKYPKLIEAMIKRPKNYNETLDYIIDLENKKEIFVIRPSQKINIKIIERNPDKLQEIYNLGVADSVKIIDKLKTFLK